MPSLYRRHRPQTLDQVVGQQHVVRTLHNAIEHDKVNHAYLFVGSRGTGKTSVAKILALSLNCVNGPTVTPCGECNPCRAITDGTSMDVIEMDAASHNSVEDIRELRENVGFVPAQGKWKVYILDEAHMLSNAAWNAFLKTLEEPPPQTIFVLATTEAHKVMPTIVDRCQRFDFRRPNIDEIGEVLQRVVTAESIEISDQALAMIARSAQGSFRDAISTLDQLVTYGGKQVSEIDVIDVLGVADSALLFKASDAVASGDLAEVFDAVADVVNSGAQISQFAQDLALHLRQLLITKTIGSVPKEFGISPEQAGQITTAAQEIDKEQLLSAVDLLTQAYLAIRAGADARLQLELALIKATGLDGNGPISTSVAKQSKMEKREAVKPSQLEKPSQPEESSQPETYPEKESEPEVDLSEIWQQLKLQMQSQDEMQLLAALIESTELISKEGDKLVVAFPSSAKFQKRKVESQQVKEQLVSELEKLTGNVYILAFELSDDLEQQHGKGQSQLSETEIVEMIKQEFGAEEVTDMEGVS